MEANKYAHGKIYKITNTEDDMIYIGCTIRPLSARLQQHISMSRGGFANCPINLHMRKHGTHKFNIELVRDFPCVSKMELINEENKHIMSVPKERSLNVVGRTDDISISSSDEIRRGIETLIQKYGSSATMAEVMRLQKK